MKINAYYIRKYSMIPVSKERISESDIKKVKLLPHNLRFRAKHPGNSQFVEVRKFLSLSYNYFFIISKNKRRLGLSLMLCE